MISKEEAQRVLDETKDWDAAYTWGYVKDGEVYP